MNASAPSWLLLEPARRVPVSGATYPIVIGDSFDAAWLGAVSGVATETPNASPRTAMNLVMNRTVTIPP